MRFPDVVISPGRPARILVLTLSAIVAATVAACGGSASQAPVSYPPDAILIKAEARTFSPEPVLIPADEAFTLAFDNRDNELHNVAIRTERGIAGDVVFRHDPIGKEVGVFEVPAVAAGTYYFLCEVHPEMTGTVVAQ